MTMTQVSLHSQSTLTTRYQTTIPRRVRSVLRLKKRDKICYTIQPNGKVLISRVEPIEEDPVLSNFLEFMANDMNANPQNVSPIDSDFRDRIQTLVSNAEIDLDSPLADEDE